MLKALFVLELFQFLFWIFGHAKNDFQVNFKFCDATDWIINNYNTYIARYLKSKGNQKIWENQKFGQLIERNMRNIFLEKSCTNMMEKPVLDRFLKNQSWAYL